MRIEADMISINLSNRLILDTVALAVRSGECVALVGPNGAGKTTLLQVMAGITTPDSGEVRYDGRRLADCPPHCRARQVGFLAQHGAVHWPITVETVVALGRMPYRRPFSAWGAADHLAIEEAMRLMAVTEFRNRTLDCLSGGERMRVLLARVLAGEPVIIMADEPLAGLDPSYQLQVMATLRHLSSSGLGIVVVLHDLAMAQRFCDRVIVMKNGRILADDAPETALNDRILATAFGIEVARGERDGQPYLMPWQAITALTDKETRHD